MDESDIERNLEDCGCEKSIIDSFCSLSSHRQIEVLSLQRKKLLEGVHEEERKISCLDYLVNRLEKERGR